MYAFDVASLRPFTRLVVDLASVAEADDQLGDVGREPFVVTQNWTAPPAVTVPSVSSRPASKAAAALPMRAGSPQECACFPALRGSAGVLQCADRVAAGLAQSQSSTSGHRSAGMSAQERVRDKARAATARASARPDLTRLRNELRTAHNACAAAHRPALASATGSGTSLTGWPRDEPFASMRITISGSRS